MKAPKRLENGTHTTKCLDQRNGASLAEPRLSGTRSTAFKACSGPSRGSVCTSLCPRCVRNALVINGCRCWQDARSGLSSSDGEVWRVVYLCHGLQKLPSVVRQECGLLRSCCRCHVRISACLWSPGSWLATPACRAEPHAGRQTSLREAFSPHSLPHVNTTLAAMTK